MTDVPGSIPNIIRSDLLSNFILQYYAKFEDFFISLPFCLILSLDRVDSRSKSCRSQPSDGNCFYFCHMVSFAFQQRCTKGFQNADKGCRLAGGWVLFSRSFSFDDRELVV